MSQKTERAPDSPAMRAPSARPERGLDAEMVKFLHGVVGVIEADAFAQHMLWSQNAQRLSWSQNAMGYLETVGHLARMPVCISLSTAVVGGHKLLFWHATSQVVDSRLIDRWLERTMPQSARRENGCLNKVDAMNFHNVFHALSRPAPPPDDASGLNPKETAP